MSSLGADALGVGPVLQATPFAREIAAAIMEDNDDVIVSDRGGYLRVVAPRVCRLSRATVEAVTGSKVRFPGELEMIMSSFAGQMRLTEHGAVWWLAGESTPDPPGPPPSNAVR
ncbi:MAG: MmoB/DmpM family protein [Ilumatobacteraceae bacterium]